MSWDPNTAATTHPSVIELAVWSPCNRFIAITCNDTTAVDVLDSVTLQRLHTLESAQGTSTQRRAAIFSPDSRILSCSSDDSVGFRQQALSVVSWDLQTGSLAGVIRWKGPPWTNTGDTSITYSADGKMVAVFHWHQFGSSANVFIFDVASGMHMHSHSLDDHTPLANGIWAYGESLRFATISKRTRAITIWEVGFTSDATPTGVETLPAPDAYDNVYGSLELLPAPCRLALVFLDGILVWDVQNSKYLLHSTNNGVNFKGRMSFSSDGRFFACSAESDIYLWKESPTGYILHKKLPFRTEHPSPLLSRNGESIVVFGDHTIRLWRTKSLITSPSSTPPINPPSSTSLITPPSSTSTRAQRTKNFVLDFSPDGVLAAVTVQDGKTVIVLNLKSGVPQLTIDASMWVYGIRVIGNTVVVKGGDGKVITWNLPAGNCVSDARMGLEDSSQIMNLDRPWYSPVGGAAISPDSRHIATIAGSPHPYCLSIYSTSTGKRLGETSIDGTTPGTTAWFSPDGCDVWCVRDSSEACRVWRVCRGRDALEASESEWRTVDVEGYPWRSSRGYQVTNDWWILGPDRKRLLMLPPPFQSYVVHRVWKGRFLALLHGGLLEPVILELDP